jgi:hypothetical protein
MMKYRVARLPATPGLSAGWDQPPWPSVPALAVARHMGEKPAHFPGVAARLGWDDESIHVLFRVEDRYVRAVAQRHQDAVCTDSCVEFFFVPGMDIENGYFNLEVNCGGTMLFHFQKVPRVDAVAIAPADLAQIAVAHSLPRRVEPEMPGPVTWTVQYRLPFGILAKYRPAPPPRAGATWRANFYKCGDLTSHPHWLTWAPVRRPRPDFHVPADFGVLEFAGP